MQLFGSSGIRGIVNEGFLQLTRDVGVAVGNLYRSLIIGCDTRTSSDAMKYAFLSGLLSAGAGASDAGVASTPSIAYVSRNFQAGTVITASHNPPQYNGIKLVNPDGSAFDAAQREQIERRVAEKSFELAPWEKIKQCTNYPRAVEQHVERILADFPTKFRLKVVVDCGCGAASTITPQLLTKLGCEVVSLNCKPSGHFPRGIEPTPENLVDLMRTVKSEKADLGIAHDGDGDRIAVIDEKGGFVSGDVLTALLARHLGAKRVVTTVDASMLIDELDIEVVRTRVGDAFVSDELRENASKCGEEVFGAEPSGCFIFPRVSLCPDGIYAAAITVQLASEHRISSLVDRMPPYSVLRGNLPADRGIMPKLETRLKERAGAEGKLETLDGLRLAFSDGWLLIRPSGTEPKIRISAEAKSEQRARELYDLGLEAIEKCLKEQERVTT
ncbi:MAG: phosphoglucosamine mutase [Dehalococcoidia bacterium]